MSYSYEFQSNIIIIDYYYVDEIDLTVNQEIYFLVNKANLTIVIVLFFLISSNTNVTLLHVIYTLLVLLLYPSIFPVSWYCSTQRIKLLREHLNILHTSSCDLSFN